MIEDKKRFTINSLKSDKKIHRSWKAELLEKTGDLIVFKGVFDQEIKHPHLGVIGRGTVSYEYYWMNLWYNVFRFHESSGELRNFYCNINQPPVLQEQTLSYVDLDIDVLVWRDFSIEILDLDEFDINAERFGYSPELRRTARESLNELLDLIKNKIFPFDFKT